MCQYLVPDRHFDYLRSIHLLSRDDCLEIQRLTGTRQTSYFIDVVISKGPDAYERLCESLLKEGTQLFIVEMLNKEFEKKKNYYYGTIIKFN